MTTEGTARGRCHWQRPLDVLDPSLLQIDDADRAALGGGFHSGQVRRAGLAVDLRQPVLRDPEHVGAGGDTQPATDTVAALDGDLHVHRSFHPIGCPGGRRAMRPIFPRRSAQRCGRSRPPARWPR